ncbi:MAG: hypothetical protein BalsKO_06740 [Balneolaceae bacterium]
MKKSSLLTIFLSLLTVTLLFACSIGNNEIEDETFSSCELNLYPPADTIIASHNSWTQTHYAERINEFRQDSIYPNSIIMLGNSLTEQGGDWSDWLNIERVKNRGIAGDNSDGVLARLGEIICAKPKSIFIMIGTNDLWTNYSEVEVGISINKIATTLAEVLPESVIYLQTIMPLEKNHEMTKRLANINNEIRSFENNDYILLDTFMEMSNSDGSLPSSLTTDGVHLTKLGYQKWTDFLKSNMQ